MADIVLRNGSVAEKCAALAQMPEVAASLDEVEMRILKASSFPAIKSQDPAKVAQQLSVLFPRIAKDAGITMPEGEWRIAQARVCELLLRYYGNFSVADIKVAFELAVMGELDEWLPKDRDGRADRQHYNRFNADWIAKILRAYRDRRQDVQGKAMTAAPVRQISAEPSEEAKEFYRQANRQNCRDVFLRYKYRRELRINGFEAKTIYGLLYGAGLADEVTQKESDRTDALVRCLMSAARGLVNEYTAHRIRREGKDSRELDFTAYELARMREIRRTFDRMINEEIQINQYI